MQNTLDILLEVSQGGQIQSNNPFNPEKLNKEHNLEQKS